MQSERAGDDAQSRYRTIYELIERWAIETPDAVALTAPGRRGMSYRSLLRLIDSTRVLLRTAGIGSESRVAVVLPNGPEMAAAFCAISCGAACAPLNPSYGEKDFEFYLTDLSASAVVVDEKSESPVVAVANKLAIPVLRLRADPEEAGNFALELDVTAEPRLSGNDNPDEDDVALLLHTSGTTSRPKLVPLRHRNIRATARNITRSLGLSPADRCLNIMPLFHIHGLMAPVIASLTAGGCVFCTPGFNAGKFFEWLDDFQPTWYSAVPTMHQAIVAHAEARGALPKARLRFIRSSSASLAPKVMEDLERLFEAPVIESYGMTEAAHQMASNPLPPAARKPGSVGPAAGPEVAIMDESGHVLDHGIRGEVVIRGENVTSGYERNQEANREAYTDGWFRTGDEGYFDPDAYLFLTGRLKEIINRGGEKISPREIEEVLLEHPAVRQAVVFSVPHHLLGEDIGAAIIVKPGQTLDPRELRSFAAESLPGFKVPAVVKMVPEIPKGPTGKLRRIGLADALGIDPIQPHASAVAERPDALSAELRGKLAPVWRRVLGLEEIGEEASFFELGGTSLQLAELLTGIEEATGSRFEMLDFIDQPTITGLCRSLERRSQNGDEPGSIPRGLISLQSKGDGPPLFCLPAHYGNFASFVELSKDLGRGQPVLGVDLVEVVRQVGNEFMPVAERITVLVKETQPEGPVLLLGYCLGGRLAYEVACRLVDEGREVAYLGLVHAHNERFQLHLSIVENFLWRIRMTRADLRIVRRSQGDARRRYTRERLTRLKNTLVAPVRRLFPHKDHAVEEPLVHLDWVPRPYSGTVVLYRSCIPRPPGRDSPQMGWDNLIPEESQVMMMPEDHRNFTTEGNIRFVAESVRPYLIAARETSGPRIPVLSALDRNRPGDLV